MLDFATILAGLGDAFSPTNLIFVIAGIIIGQFVGAIPGIGPVMTMAIAIPFTFILNPLPALSLLIGIHKGGLVGGAIPAILINTPGTPDAAATALDGYPLTKKGKPLKATKMALYSSITGDVFSDLVLITVSVPLAALALKMGLIEIFALMIFSFSIIAGLVGDTISKGIIAACLGILCACIGLDPENSTPRFIFGNFTLYDGLPIASVAIGMLAVSEIFRRLASMENATRAAIVIPKNQSPEDTRISFKEYWAVRYTLLRGATIGTILGAIPGVGSTAAAFMSYAFQKNSSKNPNSYGKGNIKGIAATESANSSVAGADFIPLLTLGLPGSASAALIISAFLVQGIQPGPLLFQEQGRLIYGLFGAMIMANMVNFGVGLFGMRLWIKIVSAPESVIFSSAILLCIVGVYLSTGGMFGVVIMLIFALLGYIMNMLGFPTVVFIIAFFLGDRFELSLGQTLNILDGDYADLVNHPVAIGLILLAMGSIYFFMFKMPNATKNTTDELSED
ncbi:MAG: tripartite tricarboxylate transporter permease [Rhizobiales bacterium]|nr:tripartite tricarboxylate transporter permease [Hyphomicrobiales bacterium]